MTGIKTYWMRMRFFISTEESLWWAYRFYANRRIRKGGQPWEAYASEKADLVLDGFPGSGNSFLSKVLKKTQGERLRLAHHLHAPNQLIRACKLKVPAVLVLRRPVDSVCSMHRRFGYPIELANKLYLDFHKSLIPWREMIQIVPFELIADDPMMAVKAIADRWELELETNVETADLEDLWAIGRNNRKSEAARQGYRNQKQKVYKRWRSVTSDDLERNLNSLYRDLHEARQQL